ncbi:UPF0755 protein [Nocardia sp. GAS34]|uniref:endolytic transglycosylase MltG n=1 Tax=unclassified Nocardia TaxID=2637762 RepID=UPI003D26051E
MNDRWLRAEERLRQSTEERRYRRSDQDWGDTESPAARSSEIPAARSGEMRAAGGDEPRARRGDRARSGRGGDLGSGRGAKAAEAARGGGGGRPARGRRARHAAPDEDDWDEYQDTGVIPRYSDAYDGGYQGEHGYEPQHGAHGYADQGYDQQGYGDQGYDQHGYDQSHPQVGYHDYADQDYGDRGYGQNYPDHGYADQGYGEPEQGEYDGRGYGTGEYPEEAYDQELMAESPARPAPRRGRRQAEEPARKQTARGPRTATKGGAQKGRREPSERGRGSRGRKSRVASRKAAERKRRRRNLMYVGTVFVVLFAVAAVYAGYKIMGRVGGPEDYAGPPGPLAVVQVHPGDTAEQIAKAMLDKGVVKSTGAFYQAAVRDSGMNSLQPGYYAIPTHIKGEDAATALMSKDSRVGNVVISEGRRLHDSTDVNTRSRNDGIYRKIADASCIGTGAAKKCLTYEQLDQAGAGTDLNALGVPQWAMAQVRQVPDRTRQLEGLIAAGTWDFDPSGTPAQILAQLVSASAHSYESTGLLTPNPAAGISLSPYQTLIASSLVEREALPADMPRVARVIVNRLNANMPLEFDSTVNYTLSSTEVATTDADRDRKTPWNTYAMAGLPATPISSPSLGAMRAMENPTAGPWLYFVTVDKQGTTLFTDSYSEHQRNIEKARQSGILDSGR